MKCPNEKIFEVQEKIEEGNHIHKTKKKKH